jgi:hypothetical protein
MNSLGRYVVIRMTMMVVTLTLVIILPRSPVFGLPSLRLVVDIVMIVNLSIWMLGVGRVYVQILQFHRIDVVGVVRLPSRPIILKILLRLMITCSPFTRTPTRRMTFANVTRGFFLGIVFQ